jgi:hypothetical protein
MKQWELNQAETPVAATNLQLHQREWELKRQRNRGETLEHGAFINNLWGCNSNNWGLTSNNESLHVLPTNM